MSLYLSIKMKIFYRIFKKIKETGNFKEEENF